jgi:glycosyltransferase involved in cell wall biosynthesis
LAKIKNIVSTEHSLVPLKDAKIWEIPFKKIYLTYRNKTIKCLITPSIASKKIMIETQGFDGGKIKIINNALKKSGKIKIIKNKKIKKIQEFKNKNYSIVGTVARLESGKGHFQYLSTIKKIVESHPKTLFVFVGGGSQLKKLKTQISNLKINRNILFAGEQKNIDSFLKIFDIFAFPSLSENFPYAILEAERSALPIVAFEIGGIPEQIKNKKNGLLVPLGNFDLFAKQIIGLLDSEKKRKVMSRNSKNIFRKKFNIKKFIKKTIAVYEDF